MTRGMVIIGGGIAACNAALALRDHGWSGAITMVGDEAQLPYDRPPLSKDFMTGQTETIPYLTDEVSLAARDIKFITSNAVVAIDRLAKSIALHDGQRIPFEKLMIATGARARRLSVSGADSSNIHYLRTIDDAQVIKQKLRPKEHVVIIGGGFIGLEVAASARKRGVDVTLIEGFSRLLARSVPTEIAEIVAATHRKAGVTIYLDAPVSHLSEDGRSTIVHLSDGRKIKGDFVVAGIGAAPNTELALEAGLSVDNGITVDKYLCASDPNIYAAGDCVSFPLPVFDGARVRLESWRNAQDQGIIAAANMLGKQQSYKALPWFWSDQYDLSMQITGLHEPEDISVRRDLANGAFILFHLNNTGRLTGASGIGPGNSVARDIRLAEMLIENHIRPQSDVLSNPDVKLKSLLRVT